MGVEMIRLTMHSLVYMTSLAQSGGYPDPDPDLTSGKSLFDALIITGPVISGKYVFKVKDGEFISRPARKPHRDRYPNASAVLVPPSVCRPIYMDSETTRLLPPPAACD
jgi:hypothetical protein